jgi:hypothetical protein
LKISLTSHDALYDCLKWQRKRSIFLHAGFDFATEYIQGNFLAGMEQISRCRREGEGAADHALSKSILSKEGVGDDTSGIYRSYFFFFLQLSTKLKSVVA